ncbi:MAG: penicillin-binding protein 2 [Acidimicrobiia bacterium]|nr:penicillin-binding protein 2 [Acidimicrobiia bacterium]
MDRSFRHVIFVLLGCFTLLFVQLNRVQIFEAAALQDNGSNTRTIQREFDQLRGEIRTRDGVVVASSEPAGPDSPFQFQRLYPEGELYAHSVGYVSFTVGAEGVERTYNAEILGDTPSQQLSDLTSLLDEDARSGSITLTLDHDLQRVAQEALGERVGSVVAMDPRTGAVLALWSYPSFDPNLVAANNSTEANAARAELLEAPGNPLRARSYRDTAFPGSTFKVITAAAALETPDRGITATEPVFETTTEYLHPLTTRPITNFGGRPCGGNLTDLLVQSCNTSFALIAAEILGPAVMVNQAEAAGFNSVPPFDLPGGVASVFPAAETFGARVAAPTPEVPAGVFENSPLLAQAAIGQFDVQATPLQMALMIAGVANDGIIPTPHILAEVADANGRVVRRNEPDPWRMSMREDNARSLQQALITAAQEGGGNTAAVPGLVVGVKTGTAQHGTDPPLSNAWIVGFAGLPDEDIELAVAVLVEDLPDPGDQTGGRIAGPIARQLFEEYFSGRI